VLANGNDVRSTKKGKMKVEGENMDESQAVYPWTLSAVTDSDFLRNSRGGGRAPWGTIVPSYIRGNLKDKRSVVNKCRHKQRNMATILVSNSSVTSLISDFLSKFQSRTLVSFFEIKHF
jgi:hypothetical protein